MAVLANPKRERFCQEVAKGSQQRDAYRTAGYTAQSDAALDAGASRLMTDPDVAARIAEIQGKAATRAEISKAWVMERLMRNAQVCLGEVPTTHTTVGEDGEAHDEEVFRRNPTAANRALELLGKEMGMFVDRSVSASTTLEEMLDRLDGRAEEPASEPRDPS